MPCRARISSGTETVQGCRGFQIPGFRSKSQEPGIITSIPGDPEGVVNM